MANRLQLSDEALDKFEAFLRRLATHSPGGLDSGSILADLARVRDDAKALVDQYLPAPVDPLVLEARKVILDSYGEPGNSDNHGPSRVRDIAAGLGDAYYEMKAVVAALKRGMELAHADYEPAGAWMVGRAGLNHREQALYAKRDS